MQMKSLLILTLVVALGYQQSTTKTVLRHSKPKQAQNHQTLREDPNKETKENALDQWPVLIGVLTQPKSKKNNQTFPNEHYILEVNREYIEASGMAKAVPIYYDLPEADLISLLGKLDGVHFTGGGLDLYNFTSHEWHPYYVTARRIFQYATQNQTIFNATTNQTVTLPPRKFLLTGICQGFEILSILASGDKSDLLRVIEYENVNRQVYWSYNTTTEIKHQSRMFSHFEDSLLNAMASQDLAFHYHTYGISESDYQSIPSFNQFFKVISTDTSIRGEQFLTAFEAYHFPIYGLMYHPEYQMLEFLSQTRFDLVSNKETVDIIQHLSRFIYTEAIHNRHLNKDAAQEAREANFHDQIIQADIDELWGRINPYIIATVDGSNAITEAYAVPPRVSTQRGVVVNS